MFNYLSRVLQEADICIFDKVPISKLFSLRFLLLVSHLGNLCIAQTPGFSPLCSPTSFMAFDFTLNPMIHCELIILPWCEVWPEDYPVCHMPLPTSSSTEGALVVLKTCPYFPQGKSLFLVSLTVTFFVLAFHYHLVNFYCAFISAAEIVHYLTPCLYSLIWWHGDLSSRCPGHKWFIADIAILLDIDSKSASSLSPSSWRHAFFPPQINPPHASTPAGFPWTPAHASSHQITLMSLPLSWSRLRVHIFSLWEEWLLNR